MTYSQKKMSIIIAKKEHVRGNVTLPLEIIMYDKHDKLVESH
jgi:hypothetical protein